MSDTTTTADQSKSKIKFKTCKCGTLHSHPTRDDCAKCAGWVCSGPKCGRGKPPEKMTCGRKECERWHTRSRNSKNVRQLIKVSAGAVGLCMILIGCQMEAGFESRPNNETSLKPVDALIERIDLPRMRTPDSVYFIKSSDGSRCAVFQGNNRGGIHCDWSVVERTP